MVAERFLFSFFSDNDTATPITTATTTATTRATATLIHHFDRLEDLRSIRSGASIL